MRIFVLISVLCIRVFAEELVPDERTAVFPQEKALFLLHSLCLQVPEGITSFWTPQLSDLRGIEESLPRYLRKVRPELANWLLGDGKQGEPRWTWLRRQATGVSRGETRYLFVAYNSELPAETLQVEREAKAKAEKMGRPYRADRWKEIPWQVNGGGASCFRVLFDLRKREFIWYEENYPQ